MDHSHHQHSPVVGPNGGSYSHNQHHIHNQQQHHLGGSYHNHSHSNNSPLQQHYHHAHGHGHHASPPAGGGVSGTSSLGSSSTSFPHIGGSTDRHPSSTSGGVGVGGSSDNKWIWVLDPMTRKLRVPVNYLVPTQATATLGTVPSLCIAFLEGRCRHPWCRQAHVMPNMIAQLRHDALNAPTCCARHNDPHDTSMLTSRFKTITITDSSVHTPIPTDCIALTVGLQRYLAHSVPADLPGPNLDVPSKLICRLHLSHRCRYLEDCNNMHVCREFDLKLHPPPYMIGPLLNLTMASRSVTLGDTAYAVTPLAAGEVTDEEFHTLCEQAQTSHYHHNHHHLQGKGSAGTSPMLHASNSPLLFGMGLDAQQQQTTASGTSPVMNHQTPSASFSTPPLGIAKLPPSPPFSSPPNGLPSFAMGGSGGQVLHDEANQHHHNSATSPEPLLTMSQHQQRQQQQQMSSGTSGSAQSVATAPASRGGGGGSTSKAGARGESPPPYNADPASGVAMGGAGHHTGGGGGGSGAVVTPGNRLSAQASSKHSLVRVYDIRTAVAPSSSSTAGTTAAAPSVSPSRHAAGDPPARSYSPA